MPSVQSGTEITMTGTFKNSAGVLTDPTTVVVTVRSPAGTTTTPSVGHPSTGVYTAVATLDLAGEWIYRFDGTGTITVSRDGAVTCTASRA